MPLSARTGAQAAVAKWKPWKSLTRDVPSKPAKT